MSSDLITEFGDGTGSSTILNRYKMDDVYDDDDEQDRLVGEIRIYMKEHGIELNLDPDVDQDEDHDEEVMLTLYEIDDWSYRYYTLHWLQWWKPLEFFVLNLAEKR